MEPARQPPVPLLCPPVLRAWVDGSEVAAGAVCIEEGGGSDASCSFHTEWSGAYVFLIVNAILWGSITVFFVAGNSSLFKKREMRRRLERLSILHTSGTPPLDLT